MLVYPEGTRGESYALRPFKKGPFVLAIGSGAPIVPVVIHGTIAVNPRGEFRASPELLTGPLSLPSGVPLVAYRTAQEALTNVSKHAQATRVAVDLSLTGGVLSLEVSDNGRGLTDEDLAKARSFGIRGLHERAGTVGGWVELSSTPQGTTLILSVPLDPRAAARHDAGHDGDGDGDAHPGQAVRPVSAPGSGAHDPSTWGEL